jgi:hypothetical protein
VLKRLGVAFQSIEAFQIGDLCGGEPVITQFLGTTRLRVGLRVATLSLLLLSAEKKLVSAGTPSILWNQPFGSANNDYSTSVSVDGLGNLYAAGTTHGNVQGTNAGQADAFIVRYDSGGNLLWSRQFGTSGIDQGFGISADGFGNATICGSTNKRLGNQSFGEYDAFITKFDSFGNQVWLRQFGTTRNDAGDDVATDRLGNIYVAGQTWGDLAGANAGPYDAFVAKYDTGGNAIWTRQFGTQQSEGPVFVSTDGVGNLYVAGGTQGALAGVNAGSYDAFVTKYDAAGNLLWTQQTGGPFSESISSVSADSLGNVFLAGTVGTDASGSGRSQDALLIKYDSAGNLLWSRQLGTAAFDTISDVSADQLGNVYLSGSTQGSLGGPNSGSDDVFVAKYDGLGNQLWLLQSGTSGGDSGNGVAAGGDGILYVSGLTADGGRSSPLGDAFVAKISDVPESVTWIYVIFLAVSLIRSRIRSRTAQA